MLFFVDISMISSQKVLERNDAGEHFPIYAICLGFELLTMIISQVTLSSCLSYVFAKL